MFVVVDERHCNWQTNSCCPLFWCCSWFDCSTVYSFKDFALHRGKFIRWTCTFTYGIWVYEQRCPDHKQEHIHRVVNENKQGFLRQKREHLVTQDASKIRRSSIEWMWVPVMESLLGTFTEFLVGLITLSEVSFFLKQGTAHVGPHTWDPEFHTLASSTLSYCPYSWSTPMNENF